MCKDRRWKRSISIGSEKVMAFVLGMMLLLSVKVSAQAAPEAGSEGWNRDEVVSYLQKGEAGIGGVDAAVPGRGRDCSLLLSGAAGGGRHSSGGRVIPNGHRPGKADPFGFGLWPGSRRRIRCQPSGKALQPGTDGPAGSPTGPLFALLALDCKGYPLPAGSSWSREALTELLISYQREDGGFSLNDQLEPDVDVTALSLLALAPYCERGQVAQSVELGLAWLSDQQLDSGGFASMGQSPARAYLQCCPPWRPWKSLRRIRTLSKTAIRLLTPLRHTSRRMGAFPSAGRPFQRPGDAAGAAGHCGHRGGGQSLPAWISCRSQSRRRVLRLSLPAFC